MSFDSDVLNEEVRVKYDFTQAKNGSSLWVQTHGERVSAMDAFSRWKEKSNSALSAVSRRVGPSDPRGDGYRIFFSAPEIAAKPIVISAVRKNASRDGNPLREYILSFTGLPTDDDVLAAIMSVEPTPQTLSEATNACRLLWTGETPKQIEYCLQRYGKTFNEIREDKRKEDLKKEHEHAERQAAKVIRLDEIKRQEAQAMARLERELGDDQHGD